MQICVCVCVCICVSEGKGKIEIQVERSRLVREGSYPVLQTGVKACLVCICLRLLKPSPSLLSLTALLLLLGVTCLTSSLSAGPEKCPCSSWVWLQYDLQWLCAGIQYSLWGVKTLDTYLWCLKVAMLGRWWEIDGVIRVLWWLVLVVGLTTCGIS